MYTQYKSSSRHLNRFTPLHTVRPFQVNVVLMQECFLHRLTLLIREAAFIVLKPFNASFCNNVIIINLTGHHCSVSVLNEKHGLENSNSSSHGCSSDTFCLLWQEIISQRKTSRSESQVYTRSINNVQHVSQVVLELLVYFLSVWMKLDSQFPPLETGSPD